MIPQGTPTARCSARRQAAASSSGESSCQSATLQSANATATSSAAEDESPAPLGRVEEIEPANPTGGRPQRPSSTATAAT